MRGINKQAMLDLIIEAKRNEPETGSFAEWLAEHMPTLTPPIEPLTLEQLREMSYTDWVWVVFPELPPEENEWVRASQLYSRYSHEHYGKTWIAYHRPPEVSP